MGAHFTAAEDATIVKMWNAREKVSVIAATLGRSYYSIDHRIRHLDIKRRYEMNRPIFSEGDIERMMSMWLQGVTTTKIGEVLGFSRVQINRKIHHLRHVKNSYLPYRYRKNCGVA